MKNKESLSDKLSETGTGHMVCLASDIREYVRKLKEEMEHNEDLIHDLNQFQEGLESFGGIKSRLKTIIDEIFGKDLI